MRRTDIAVRPLKTRLKICLAGRSQRLPGRPMSAFPTLFRNGPAPARCLIANGCRYPRNAIPNLRNFSVGILPHLQNGHVFPSLTSVRHPVGDVAHDKSTVGAASWSRTAARVGTRNLDWSKGGNGFRSLRMRLVAFLATASRGAAAITTVYRLYDER